MTSVSIRGSVAQSGVRQPQRERLRARTFLRRAPSVTARWEGTEEVLLFDFASGRALVTNEAGLIAFWLCDGKRCAKDVMEELRACYYLGPVVERGIRDFICQLLAWGMVDYV